MSPRVTLTVLAGKKEADNRILECAVAGNADLIASGDTDLLDLEVHGAIPIVRPADALRALGGR